MNVSHKWRVIAVVMLAPTLAIMDTTIVSVILPELQSVFHTDFQTVSWVVSAYFLAQAAVLPIIGYVSDRVGSKMAFLTALALFTAGSLLCSLAPTPELLIAFRVLQGVGGGALLPLSIAIAFRIFSPEERSKASAIFGIPIVMAPAFAPTIGGYLSTSWHWNAVFLINVPFGLLDLLLISLIMPTDIPNQHGLARETRQSFDILGLVLSLVGVTILVFGVSAAGAVGWGQPTVLTSLLVGAAILIVFVVVELRVSDPVLDLRLFKNYTFTIANILVWLVVGVFSGGLFLIPFFLENVRNDTALAVGVFLIGQGVASAVSTSVAGALYNRVGPRTLVICGLLFLGVGTYGLTQIHANTTGQDLQVWLILRGIGMGLVFQPLNTLALSVVSNKGMAKASSLVNVTRQVTTAAAVAALTTYLTEQTVGHGVGPQATAQGMADTFWVVLILTVVCIAPALFLGRDPAIEAIKKAQLAKASESAASGQVQENRSQHATEPLPATQPQRVLAAQSESPSNAISTLTTDGEQIMGPEILLWPYPKHDVMEGSLLVVGSDQFCVLKSGGANLKIYEAGQHTVQIPSRTSGYLGQLTFSGELILDMYQVLYVNRAKLIGKARGVVLSREMVEVEYQVHYTISVATREDVVQLVQHMPYRVQTLSMQDISAYAGPVVERVVSQLALIAPVEQAQELQMRQDITELVYLRLHPVLSRYGITLDTVEVLLRCEKASKAKGYHR